MELLDVVLNVIEVLIAVFVSAGVLLLLVRERTDLDGFRREFSRRGEQFNAFEKRLESLEHRTESVEDLSLLIEETGRMIRHAIKDLTAGVQAHMQLTEERIQRKTEEE